MKPTTTSATLNAGVVDVVLNLDPLTIRLQDPLESIAEDGVAHVADVSGLVRIDRRVFDADFCRSRLVSSSESGKGIGRNLCRQELRPVKVNI
jgi:hypothetical protein